MKYNKRFVISITGFRTIQAKDKVKAYAKAEELVQKIVSDPEWNLHIEWVEEDR